MSRKILLLTAFALALVLGPAFADDETFVRLEQKGNDAALQTAYATYRLPGSDVEVVLYGVVHIADQAYYDRVQADLDACDIVLYEGVAPSDPEAGPSEDMASLSDLQQSMGELLGLAAQWIFPILRGLFQGSFTHLIGLVRREHLFQYYVSICIEKFFLLLVHGESFTFGRLISLLIV